MDSFEGAPSWLHTPPSQVPSLPVTTLAQRLPFGEIHWEDFEKLCYRIVRLESDSEYCKQYGLPGGEQGGIDIFARVNSSGKYRVYQCKREKDFGPAKIASAVEKFIEGEWIKKSDRFILCTQESLRTANRADELEKQAKVLHDHGVVLIAWDEEELSSKLKALPEIVDDFFGRAWVKAFCGEEAASKLGERLDLPALTELRSKLFSLYVRVFNQHDRGIPLSDALPISERFIVPDVEDRQTMESSTRSEMTLEADHVKPSGDDASVDAKQHAEAAPRRNVRPYVQKLPVQNWLAKGKRSLIFGDPGSGKSTLLRFLAIDLLGDSPTQPQLAEKWGDHIPVWLPFALWTKLISEGGSRDKSVSGILSGWLDSWDAKELVPLIEKALKDKRLLLLIDGLDEHSSNDSAQIALNHLQVFLGANDVSTIATSRPHGFERLGMRLDGWQQARIASLSIIQQQDLSRIWFRANSEKINPSLNDDGHKKDVEQRVATFFVELARSTELRELARNPLLLSLLISFQLTQIRLPLGRFKAYETLTDHLISIHPRSRRVAADAASSQGLSDSEVKKALAHLATSLQTDHPEGLIPEEQALDVLIDFLTNGEEGFGMDKRSAREAAVGMLAKAEDSLGIIVKKTQTEISFYHRTIQEYLVSFNISRYSLEKQASLVSKYCTDPLWREVVLGLFQITNRPDDARRLVDAIRGRTLNRFEGKIVNGLLSEIIFGDYNCPPVLAKDLSGYIFQQLELETWAPYREELLGHVLDGLRSSIMGDVVKEKIWTWFPGRLGWNAAGMFEAMVKWDKGPDLLECLFRGLNNEEYRVKKTAAATLAKVYGGEDEVAERMIERLGFSDDPVQAAAIVDGLILGWPQHPQLRNFIDICANSSMPEMVLVGIRGRVSFNTHKEQDFDKLIKLADTRTSYYLYRNEVADIFIKGWPKSAKLKQLCFKASKDRHDRKMNLDSSVAWNILLEGYAMDDEVADCCVKELEKDYPFSMNSHEAFAALASNFKDHPKVIEALDKWLPKSKFHPAEQSYASRVGRTQAFKTCLIDGLKESFPHWAANGLVEGWGIEDKEVSDALTPHVMGPAGRASNFGHLLPKILKDKKICRSRLIEILKDPDCERYDFVMEGLIELGAEGDTEVVDIGLQIVSTETDSRYVDGLRAALIGSYAFDSRVRDLALKELDVRDGEYKSVALAFGNDPDLRQRIIDISTPLPTPMRQIIASYLSQTAIDERYALSVLSFYDHERDEEVKVQTSIGYHTRLKNLGDDIQPAIEKLSESIVCGGPDNEERRLAAFCGLTILDRLDVLRDAKNKFGQEGSKATISSISGMDLNLPYAHFLLKNWTKIKEYFKDDFSERIFQHASPAHRWGRLTRIADEYPEPRQEALNFLISQTPKIAEGDSLRFLARVQPGGNLLLEYCLNTLGLEHGEPVPGGQHNVHIRGGDEIVAVEILGDQFGGNQKVLDRIIADSKGLPHDYVIPVVSEGWPESKELKDLLQALADSRRRCSENVYMRFFCHRAGLIRMYRELIKIIRTWESQPVHRIVEVFVRPLVRRVRKDAQLAWVLQRHLGFSGKPSEKVSIVKLIYKANGLTPDLKHWIERELNKQHPDKFIEVGLDITSGKYVSVPYALYEVLENKTRM